MPRENNYPERVAVREAAIAQADTIICEVWGEPTQRRKNEWRWGTNGSRSAHVHGTKAGAWSDFETGDSGDLFELWAIYALGMPSAKADFARVLRSLADRVGVRGEVTPEQRAEIDRRAAEREAESQRQAAAEAQRKANMAATLRGVVLPIDGTPAETYLRSRGLTIMPDSTVAGFIPADAVPRTDGLPYLNLPSLVVWATDALGAVTGGQRIVLQQDGTRATYRDGRKLEKFGFGRIKGSAVRIAARSNGSTGILVCEGPETALSLSEAKGMEVWAVLSSGSFGALHSLPDVPIILCPDQDATASPAAEQFEKATAELHRQGVNLWVARSPEPIGSKGDFNDTAQRAGMQAVRNALKQAYRYADTLPVEPGQVVDSPCEAATLSADEVGQATQDAIARFIDHAREGDQGLIKASLGTGKSHALRVALADKIKAEPSFRALIRVPIHKLADEFAEDLQALGVSCGVYRGAEAPDPAAPGLTMCRRPDDLKEVRAAGGAITDLCGAARSGCALCPFHPANRGSTGQSCSYQKQDLRTVSVVIVAGDVSLSNTPPSAIRRMKVKHHETGEDITPPDFDLVVLDETSPLSLVTGADRLDRVALGVLLSDLDQLAAMAGHDCEMEWPHDPASIKARLSEVHEVLETARAGRSYVTCADFDAQSLGAPVLEPLRSALFAYLPEISPSDRVSEMSGDQIREHLMFSAQLSRSVKGIQRLLFALSQGMHDARLHGTEDQPLATVKLGQASSDQGVLSCADCVTRAVVRSEYLDSRVLILDGTPEIDLLRAWFPKLRLLADSRARDGDGVTRVQLVDSLMSYSAIRPQPGSADYRRQINNTFRPCVVSAGFGALFNGPASLIMPKGSKEYIESAAPDMPDLITLGHFGGVRGSNAFKDSRVMTTAGRQAIPPARAERLAAVISGKPVQTTIAGGMYEKPVGALLMRDGTGRAVFNERHPDPIAEAVRRTVTEGELDQSQGRGRAVRRGRDNPLLDIRLSSVASDQPVDVIWTLDDLSALGGVAGVLLASGCWPIGRGRSRAIQSAVRSTLARWGMDDPPPDLATLAGGSDAAARDYLRNQIARSPAFCGLVTGLDSAFQNGSPTAIVAGVEVPLAGWFRVSITWPGAERAASCSVMTMAETAEEAAQRAATLFPECDVSIAGGKDSSKVEDRTSARLRAAARHYGMIPLNATAAASLMPEIWRSRGAAQRDLSALKDVDSGKPLSGSHSYREYILGSEPLKPDFESTSLDRLLVVQFRPEPSEIWQRPIVIQAVVFADNEADAQRRVSDLFGCVTEFAVAHEPEPDQDLSDVSLTVDIGLNLTAITFVSTLAKVCRAMPRPSTPLPVPSLPAMIPFAVPPAITVAQRVWDHLSAIFDFVIPPSTPVCVPRIPALDAFRLFRPSNVTTQPHHA